MSCRFTEATHRTTRWLDRCIAAHSRPSEQNLFAIVQGGLDPELRDISLKVVIPSSRDKLTGTLHRAGLNSGRSNAEFLWGIVCESKELGLSERMSGRIPMTTACNVESRSTLRWP